MLMDHRMQIKKGVEKPDTKFFMHTTVTNFQKNATPVFDRPGVEVANALTHKSLCTVLHMNVHISSAIPYTSSRV